MELHLNGVKLPPLWSPQDIVLRQYIEHKTKIDIARTRILAMSAFGQLPDDKQWQNSVNSALKSFITYSYGLEAAEKEEENRMRKEFEHILNTKPVLEKNSDGKLTVTGL